MNEGMKEMWVCGILPKRRRGCLAKYQKFNNKFNLFWQMICGAYWGVESLGLFWLHCAHQIIDILYCVPFPLQVLQQGRVQSYHRSAEWTFWLSAPNENLPKDFQCKSVMTPCNTPIMAKIQMYKYINIQMYKNTNIDIQIKFKHILVECAQWESAKSLPVQICGD